MMANESSKICEKDVLKCSNAFVGYDYHTATFEDFRKRFIEMFPEYSDNDKYVYKYCDSKNNVLIIIQLEDNNEISLVSKMPTIESQEIINNMKMMDINISHGRQIVLVDMLVLFTNNDYMPLYTNEKQMSYTQCYLKLEKVFYNFYSNVKRNFTGMYKSYHACGMLDCETDYVDEIKHGIECNYNYNHQLQKIEMSSKKLYKNGIIDMSYIYKHDKLARSYHYVNGRSICTTQYIDDEILTYENIYDNYHVMKTIVKKYNKNNILIEEFCLHADKYHICIAEEDWNEQCCHRGGSHCCHGIMITVVDGVEYHHKKKYLSDKNFHFCDILHGYYKNYNINGILVKQCDYNEGLKHGKCIHYEFNKITQTNDIICESNYFNGRKDGFVKKFKNNLLVEQCTYLNGVFVDRQNYYK